MPTFQLKCRHHLHLILDISPVYLTRGISDPDHLTDDNKGIKEEYFWYKNVKDRTWTEGKIPDTITVGETYLVKYQVKDMEETLSLPTTISVKTSNLLSYEEDETGTSEEPMEPEDNTNEEERKKLLEAKNNAITWLKAQADENGSWSKDGLINTTCSVLAVLQVSDISVDSTVLDKWLVNHASLNVDEQCHAIWGKQDVDARNKLWEQQNEDGGFGLTDGYQSDVYDTLLVLMTEYYMQEQGYPAVDSTKIQQALYYIAMNRNTDGGCGYNKNDVSRVVLTAEYAILLDRWQMNIISDNSLMSFCEKQYNGDFSENTFMEQCMLARYMQQTKASGWTRDELSKVIATQQENGSIYEDIQDTMLFIILLNEQIKEGE